MTSRQTSRERLGAWFENRLGFWLVAPALVMLGAFTFYPVAGSLWLSLHRQVLSLPSRGEPFVGLANYHELVTMPVLWRPLHTTLVFVAPSTTLETVLGLALALCLHASFRGRGWVRAAILVPWAMPTVVTSQMWRFLLNDRYGPLSYYLFGGLTPLADPSGALPSIM